MHIEALKTQATAAGYKVEPVPPLSERQALWRAVDPAGAVIFTGSHLKAWAAVRFALEPAPVSAYRITQHTAAGRMIAANNAACRLEEGNGPRVDLYHVLASLLTWADAESVDFDATLSELRADLNGEPAPASKGSGPVVVTLETGDGARVEVVARFDTIAGAEIYLGGPGIDAKALQEGRYGIDTPHGVADDMEAGTLAQKLGFQVFRSMGSVYYAPPGVGVVANVSGKGWKGPFDSHAAAALAALATVEP